MSVRGKQSRLLLVRVSCVAGFVCGDRLLRAHELPPGVRAAKKNKRQQLHNMS